MRASFLLDFRFSFRLIFHYFIFISSVNILDFFGALFWYDYLCLFRCISLSFFSWLFRLSSIDYFISAEGAFDFFLHCRCLHLTPITPFSLRFLRPMLRDWRGDYFDVISSSEERCAFIILSFSLISSFSRWWCRRTISDFFFDSLSPGFRFLVFFILRFHYFISRFRFSSSCDFSSYSSWIFDFSPIIFISPCSFHYWLIAVDKHFLPMWPLNYCWFSSP